MEGHLSRGLKGDEDNECLVGEGGAGRGNGALCGGCNDPERRVRWAGTWGLLLSWVGHLSPPKALGFWVQSQARRDACGVRCGQGQQVGAGGSGEGRGGPGRLLSF